MAREALLVSVRELMARGLIGEFFGMYQSNWE
jgi:hypothetical protein